MFLVSWISSAKMNSSATSRFTSVVRCSWSRGLYCIHRPGTWQNSVEIANGINLTSSLDILQAIAVGKGPQDYLVILGFSGWASGQLESELQQNSWLTSTCDADLLFHQKPEDKWQVAFDSLGFDINMLSPVSGNA